MEKAYAVDAMIATVRGVGDSEPVFFQRNGCFYVASPQGFGRMSYGLSLSPQNPENKRYMTELPEIENSQDLTIREGEGLNEKLRLKESELERTRPLIMHEDSGESFSLESMANLAKALQKIGDDGNIRLVSHYTSYHSHKHGYAADGTDTSLDGARVMQREKYLEIMRSREDGFFEGLLKATKEQLGRVYESSSISYMMPQGRVVHIPDVLIATPNVMAAFPRRVFFDHHNRNSTWQKDTDFSRPVFSRAAIYDRLPFSFSCIINRQAVNVQNTKELETELTKKLTGVSDDIAGLNKAMPQIEAFLTRINGAHNAVLK